MVYGAVLTCFGSTAVALSLTEMASMYVECSSTQLSLLTAHSLVILSFEPSIVGRPTLHLSRLSSGDSFKVGDMVRTVPRRHK